MRVIPTELLKRISERASDPMRRTYMSGAAATARLVDFGAFHDELHTFSSPDTQQAQAAFDTVVEAWGGIESAAEQMRGRMMMTPQGFVMYGGEGIPSGPQPLAPTPSPAEIAEAEATIGRSLPEDLKQLYTIADGGFGPGDLGIFKLQELISRHCEQTRGPFGPLGQPWPANLLTLAESEPMLLCLDLDDGALIVWDPEAIEDKECDADWRRSFRPEQPSLAALMECWLDAPTAQEELADVMQEVDAKAAARRLSPVTDLPMMIEDPALQAEVEIGFLADSKALRKSCGLPETDWEDEIRRRHGLL